jgi:hypothetical protein
MSFMRWEAFEYAGPSLILIDNCSCRATPWFLEFCENERGIPIYFPLHDSNQLQPLDLLIFGVNKRLLVRINRLDSLNI